MIKKISTLLLMFASVQISFSQCPTDVFGVAKFYPTLTSTREWNSAHWNNGIARTVKYASDTYDPTDWTEDHSGSTNGFYIDGAGVMNMSGGSPRFHINSTRTTKGSAQFFLNIEFTAYYRRIGTTGADYGGMIVGARSAPLGHASSGGNDCDASTYYSRFRHDGKWDFEKELKHPTSDYWSGSGFHTQDPLWSGGRRLPENRWIGMKYIITNIENNTKVKLEVYIDSTSNGNPVNGGEWKKVGEVIDAGNWPAAASAITGCSYTDQKMIILQGHGTLLLRTDGDQAEYKMVSIREIDPTQPYTYPCITTAIQKSSAVSYVKSYPNPSKENITLEAAGEFTYSVYSVSGNVVVTGKANDACTIGNELQPGIYVISVRMNKGVEQIKFIKE
ncbi:T9SS type A sorting domain-containing protein [Cytophaga aurantiaca]|uniref:T9SS type A sorting domain-containing protein n=1 Tax=Cytophaga aurantiaca TaxID=29530 RepID=UPI000373CC3E|nr:T9SS type A sorting domain-containing protein [Cytophaga aurantiaca]